MGTWVRKSRQATGLLEWTTVKPEAFVAYLKAVTERISTYENRPEEARTLKIDGLFRGGPRTALVYQCSQQPTNLCDVLLNVDKPSGDDRRALSRIITAQVRSLHVYFQLYHTALQTESFVFFGNTEKPDLTKPYISIGRIYRPAT